LHHNYRMKKLLLALCIIFVSCKEQQEDITGHWSVVKQFDAGKEVPSSTPGITFHPDGTLEYEFMQEPSFLLPKTYFRVENDSLHWTTKQMTTDGEKLDSGKICIEWQGEELILRRSPDNYTILKREPK
jgi:hypothetical protein